MKIREVIEECDSLKPNQYDRGQKESWILELEQRVVSEIWKKSEKYKFMEIPLKVKEELLVEDPYTGIYLKWLFLKIDLYNDELDKYNNDALLFNTEYADYAAYFRRNNMPAQ